MVREVSTEEETAELNLQMKYPDKEWEFPRTRGSMLKVGALYR